MDAVLLEKIKSFCAYQERSHYEVRSKLLNMQVYGLDLERVMTLLIEENYLNEERFAKAYAGGKFRLKQWGRQKIKEGLRLHQVSSYCVNQGMKEIEEDDYLQTFHKLAERKWMELNKEKSFLTRMNKLKNFMLQRGFESDYIYSFLENKKV